MPFHKNVQLQVCCEVRKKPHNCNGSCARASRSRGQMLSVALIDIPPYTRASARQGLNISCLTASNLCPTKQPSDIELKCKK
jgi:hypothetical protein